MGTLGIDAWLLWLLRLFWLLWLFWLFQTRVNGGHCVCPQEPKIKVCKRVQSHPGVLTPGVAVAVAVAVVIIVMVMVMIVVVVVSDAT